MSKLSNATLIRTNQLYANQSDVIAHVVNEILCCLLLRLGWQLIIIHLATVLPVHPKDETLPHKRERSTSKLNHRR